MGSAAFIPVRLSDGLWVAETTEQENMGRTLEMFEKPRKPRQWLMHVSDGGGDGPDDVWVRFQCQRCELETEWMKARTVTEAKRGIPCPTCNATHNAMYTTSDQ